METISAAESAPGHRASLGVRLDQAATAEEVRTILLDYLRGHRRWYARWSTLNGLAYHLATLLIIIFSAAASILAALDAADPLSRALSVIFPAVSAVAAALLTQFRFRDMCHIRESGRLGVERLICEAMRLPRGSTEDALKAATDLRMRAHDIEERQLALWVSDAALARKDETGH